jgi:hypothetical protein
VGQVISGLIQEEVARVEVLMSDARGVRSNPPSVTSAVRCTSSEHSRATSVDATFALAEPSSLPASRAVIRCFAAAMGWGHTTPAGELQGNLRLLQGNRPLDNSFVGSDATPR